jgi:hypothetical protein
MIAFKQEGGAAAFAGGDGARRMKRVRSAALNYLGYAGQGLGAGMEAMLDAAIAEAVAASTPKAAFRRCRVGRGERADRSAQAGQGEQAAGAGRGAGAGGRIGRVALAGLGVALPGEDLPRLLEGCEECVVSCATLGAGVDAALRRLAVTDMARAAVLDAAASAYLEEWLDAREEALGLGPRTFRFAPGYGDCPVSLNQELARAMGLARALGATVTPGGAFVPQKTILGIFGLGGGAAVAAARRSCGACPLRGGCPFLRRKSTCYKGD